jgi:hypothetical protein
VTSRLNISGCSMQERCEAEGMTSSRAPGMAAAIASDIAGGVPGSSAPAMTRVGALMAPMREVMSRCADRGGAADVACRRRVGDQARDWRRRVRP